MLKGYSKKINIFVGTGLLLQVLYFIIPHNNILTLIMLCGIILFTVGCCYYAKGKGYPWIYGLLALIFNIFGLLILVILRDKNKQQVVGKV
jgi:hypothetical protein